MKSNFNNSMYRRGQIAAELAVFGAILLFVIGFIVRQSMMQGYRQNHILRAMRVAMLTSYKFSEGLEGANRGIGDASRNTASVLLVEDRLSSDHGKYGAIDRIPLMIQGTASHSRNLFLPVDPGEFFNLPVMDLVVNGVRIPLITAGFKTVPIFQPQPPPPPPTQPPFQIRPWEPPWWWIIPRVPYYFYTKNFNSPTNDKWCDGVTIACPLDNMTADERFDLDRNGSPDVPVEERQYFAWQWLRVPATSVNENMAIDVDGDLKEEAVIEVQGGNLVVIDYQEGDVDFTINDRDLRNGVRPTGFTQDLQLYTLSDNGTYYLIEEGKLFNNGRQFVRNAWRKDTIDIVSRQFQLSRNTGRFCSGPVLNTGETNPVEVCGNCFSDISRTCLDTGTNILYIRSRLLDRHGRKWVTDLGNDDEVNFIIP